MTFKEFRLDLAMTQQELAKALGVSPLTISGWETRRFTPSSRMLRRVSKWAKRKPAEMRQMFRPADQLRRVSA